MTVATGGFNPAVTSDGVTTPASFDWGPGFKALQDTGSTVNIAGYGANGVDLQKIVALAKLAGISI
jgi:hypothetical protein